LYFSTLLSGGREIASHLRVNFDIILSRLGDFDGGDYETAVKDALEEEDRQLAERGMTQGGSTVSLCLVDVVRGVIFAANIGDTHIAIAKREDKDRRKYTAVSEKE
jgi:hypothetical protein